MSIKVNVDGVEYDVRCEYLSNCVPHRYAINHWRMFATVEGVELDVFDDNFQRGIEAIVHKIRQEYNRN